MDNKQDEELEAPLEEPAGKSVPVEDYKRLAADFDNYRKRAEKSLAAAKAAGEAGMASNLLAVLDDFDSAMEHYKDDREVHDGIANVRKRLFDVLKSHGLEAMASCEGKAFDADAMDAASTDPGAPAGTVCRELRAGYSFKGEIIRHPLVVVGSNK